MKKKYKGCVQFRGPGVDKEEGLERRYEGVAELLWLRIVEIHGLGVINVHPLYHYWKLKWILKTYSNERTEYSGEERGERETEGREAEEEMCLKRFPQTIPKGI